MHMPPRMTTQPALDGRVLMCCIVVDNGMDVEVLRDFLVDLFQEREKLLVTVLGPAPSNDCAIGNIQSSKECCGPMSNVIMGNSFNIAQSHRQQGLRTIQGLNLGLFVNTQHHGFVRRTQIQTDNVADFLDKERVRGELKILPPVRLKPKGSPNPMNGR